MFQFAQGATHIWDTHLLKLSEISRQYESQLIKLRNSHDLDNQTIEANLDYVLDRLRQSGTKIVKLTSNQTITYTVLTGT